MSNDNRPSIFTPNFPNPFGPQPGTGLGRDVIRQTPPPTPAPAPQPKK